MPIVCRAGFGLPGVRQGSEATRPGWARAGSGRVVATGRNDLRGSHRLAVSNPLQTVTNPVKAKQFSSLGLSGIPFLRGG